MSHPIALHGPTLRMALERHVPGKHSVLEELARADRARVEKLLALATTPQVNLARCLHELHGADDQRALSAFRGLRKRFNEAATEVGCAVSLAVDSAKKSLPVERLCWFTGEDPVVEQAERFSHESTAGVGIVVRQRALASSSLRLESPAREAGTETAPSSTTPEETFQHWLGLLPSHPQRPRARRGTLGAMENVGAPSKFGDETDALQELLAWAGSTRKESSIFYAVLGDYGMGKTTTLKLLTRELLERRRQGENLPLPIYIDLRMQLGAPTDVPTLTVLLDEVIRRNHRLSEPSGLTPAAILRLVREEGALLIFDGLDEKIVHLPTDKATAYVHMLWQALPPVERQKERVEGVRPGRMVISCRSHYFRDVFAQNDMLGGQGREGMRAADFPAMVLCPFSETQIRDYLREELGSAERAEQVLQAISKVHNLRELVERPVLLHLLAERFSELEQLVEGGEAVNAARVYEKVVSRWLTRDEGKHQLDPAHKRLLMERLAGWLAMEGRQELPAEELEFWLDDFLDAEPTIAKTYADRPRTVLKEDLRTATFLVRPEAGGASGPFRFAHTSLQEFFLASGLLRALREGRTPAWDRPPISRETLDFLGQLMQVRPEAEALKTWEALLGGEAPRAALELFRFWLRAWDQGWPRPEAPFFNLPGADLEEWTFRGTPEQPLPMAGANLAGALLNRSRWHQVDLSHANLEGADARQSEFNHVRADGIQLAQANFAGARWRHGSLSGVSPAPLALAGSSWLGVLASESALRDGAGVFWAGAPRSVSTPGRIVPNLGHQGYVYTAAFSPDGGRILSGSWDNSLRLWDSESGLGLLALRGHLGSVCACAFSPDGATLLSGSYDGTLRTFEATSGEPRLVLEGHPEPVSACAFAPDGRTIVSASFDRTVRLWESSSGRLLAVWEGHRAAVTAVQYAPDGRLVVSASKDHTLRLWDAEGQLLRQFGHSAEVHGCAFSPDGQLIVSGSEDGFLTLWEAATGRRLRVLRGHQGPVLACAFHPAGRQILSASRDRTLRLWASETGRCTAALARHEEAVFACGFSPDGTRAVSASGDKSILVWDLAAARPVIGIPGHEGSVYSCRFSPRGDGFLTGGWDTTLRRWDGASHRCEGQTAAHPRAVSTCAWSPDGTRVVSGSADRTLQLHEAGSLRTLRTLSGHGRSITDVCFAPDGARILSSSADRTLRLWDAGTGDCVRVLEGHEKEVTSCAFTPDGGRILSASSDLTLRQWSADTGETISTMAGHEAALLCCAASPDGRHALTGSEDRTLRLWDLQEGSCIRALAGHRRYVSACAFGPGGELVASGSWDNDLKLWTLDGECRQTLRGHRGFIYDCAFSPDGRTLLSASWDKTARLWDVATGGCLAIYHHLPGEEWAAVAGDETRVLAASPGAWRWMARRPAPGSLGAPCVLPAEADCSWPWVKSGERG